MAALKFRKLKEQPQRITGADGGAEVVGEKQPQRITGADGGA